MAFNYDRSEFKTLLASEIQNRNGMLVDEDGLINRAVRKVTGMVDLRTARRKATLSPSLYNGIYDYVCPSDLDGHKIIDIPAQAKRADGEFYLVPSSEFAVNRDAGAIAIRDYNGTRSLQIASAVDSNSLVVSSLDSLTAGSSDGSSWALFGDAENVARDDADYAEGNGAISFDISAAGGTTAGIQHSQINALDISDYLGGTSSFFVWAYITSTTNLTNYILRFGTDSSNYYSKTTTTRHDGTAFVNGWNLLRFDLSSLTETGSVTDTDIGYFVIYMTKTAGKVSETDYKFDYLVLKKGVKHEVEYYTSYGWQTAAGAYLENSTDDTDVLVAEKDELELILLAASSIALRECREIDLARDADDRLKEAVKQYKLRNPSEAKIMTNEYHRFITE